MRKFSKSIISKISIFCGFALIISAPFAWNFFNPDKKNEKAVKNDEKYFSQLIFTLSEELLKRWRLGDVEQVYQNKGFSCPELIANELELSGEFFKCNFLYLECFLEGKTSNDPFFKIERENITYLFTPQKNSKGKFITFTKKGEPLVTLLLKDNDFKVRFKLKDSCRSTYLPEKVYSAGEISGKGQIYDNYGQDIYLDKSYVTYKDKYQLQIASGADWKIIDPKLVATVYTEINFQKRKEFCHKRGGKLLKSRLLDAASFFPTSNENPNVHFYKHPYPWKKGRIGSFFHEAKLSSRFTLKKEDCDKAYVKGCENLGVYVPDNTHSISWMGLRSPLGAYPESVENDFFPKENLKVSSFYLPAYSSWHEVGLRGHWRKEGFAREDFDLGKFAENTFEALPPYQVAFRCFYERGMK